MDLRSAHKEKPKWDLMCSINEKPNELLYETCIATTFTIMMIIEEVGSVTLIEGMDSLMAKIGLTISFLI
jgi:hypothetical protein